MSRAPHHHLRETIARSGLFPVVHRNHPVVPLVVQDRLLSLVLVLPRGVLRLDDDLLRLFRRLLQGFLALVLLYFANVWFGTSIGGLMDPIYVDEPWSTAKLLSILEHLWVPVVVIGTSGTASMIRRLRANMLDELQKQYVITAKAKGLHPLKALIKYPLRTSLNPFIADIGNMLPQIISGSAIVSMVLSLPTTGPMLISALQSQDMYLAGSFLIFLALLTVIGMFLSDLALAWLVGPGPRLRKAPCLEDTAKGGPS